MSDRFKEIKRRLLELAECETDIEAVLEIGSQTREQNPADEFSDLDLIIAVREPKRCLYTGWLVSRLGDPLISFTEPTLAGATERRVLFEGSLDVDMVFVTPEQLSGGIESGQLTGILSRGSRVLFDSMGISESLRAAPMPGPETLMSQEEFLNNVNDFWFHTVWAAKKLRRGELYIAVTCINGYLSHLLLRMIELYERSRRPEGYDVWHKGRMLELWAGEDVTAGLRDCFAHYDGGDIARALYALAGNYSRMARAGALALGYPYPERAEQSATDILKDLLGKQQELCII